MFWPLRGQKIIKKMLKKPAASRPKIFLKMFQKAFKITKNPEKSQKILKNFAASRRKILKKVRRFAAKKP